MAKLQHIRVILCLVLVIPIAGCTTNSPYPTGGAMRQAMLVGAAVGGVTGGVVGNNNRIGTAGGVAAGTLAGAAIGAAAGSVNASKRNKYGHSYDAIMAEIQDKKHLLSQNVQRRVNLERMVEYARIDASQVQGTLVQARTDLANISMDLNRATREVNQLRSSRVAPEQYAELRNTIELLRIERERIGQQYEYLAGEPAPEMKMAFPPLL